MQVSADPAFRVPLIRIAERDFLEGNAAEPARPPASFRPVAARVA